MRRPSRSLLAAATLSLVLAGCGDSGDDTNTVTPPTAGPKSGPPASGGVVLTISGFAYNPDPLTVTPGASIDVTNADSAVHDVKADEFDSGDVEKDQTVTFKAPTNPGTYTYICTYHSNMKGSIIVA